MGFSIYIHVPWCKRRCPYCNFYLVVGRPSTDFVDAILAEWEARKANFPGLAQTLYFGGGTPSLIAPSEIARLIDHFMARGVLARDAEITLEANPEDLTEDYVYALAHIPVNRVSLGIQSFDDDILRRLGRKHTAAMARESIDRLSRCGFKNISVDQIIGVPDEENARIRDALAYLCDAGIVHISSYLLTIEEGTLFHRQKMSPSDDAQADAYLMVQQELIRLGYVQYDISSYAKPGFMSWHNQAYWAGHDYIGLGPGAHSMRRLLQNGVERAHNQADLAAWLFDPSNNKHRALEILTPTEALRESLAFGLRNMVVGTNPKLCAEAHGAPLPQGFYPLMNKFKDLGWIAERDEAHTITQSGALFADAIMREILSC